MIKLVGGIKFIKDLCNKIKSYPPFGISSRKIIFVKDIFKAIWNLKTHRQKRLS